MPVGSWALLSIATSTNLGSIQWSEIASITLPSAYKLMQMEVDDHQLLSETYQARYPEKNIQANMFSEVSRRYVSVYLAGEKIGSKLECRSLRSARVMAWWTRNDGKIDPSEATRPGFVKFFFVNCIKRLERSTRSMCSPVLSSAVKTHRGPFTAGLLRYGDRVLSIEYDLQPSCLGLYSGVTASLILHVLKWMEMRSSL